MPTPINTSSRDMIEPEALARADTIGASEAEVFTSIAISLKRISDALTYQAAGNENIFDFISRMSAKP